jgi:hypothetical protein
MFWLVQVPGHLEIMIQTVTRIIKPIATQILRVNCSVAIDAAVCMCTTLTRETILSE